MGQHGKFWPKMAKIGQKGKNWLKLTRMAKLLVSYKAVQFQIFVVVFNGKADFCCIQSSRFLVLGLK